jgi:uncharacterized protein YutE (UPF0331/DUF86 family)
VIEKFQYYIDNNLVRAGSSDKEEALSLIRKSINRLTYIVNQKLNERNAEFIFEDVYEAIREASQSLMAIKGYKPYSHEAIISFLLEFYNLPKEDISTFDRYRILRNKCVYKGVKVSAIVCKESINFLNRFLPKIKCFFEKESGTKL